ncbi:MAG: ParB N-terminal domain-containing protein [Planctomycetia bacterium]|nr:ParB N-terminal domain-containing protein [Planctomycetia bacterium]
MHQHRTRKPALRKPASPSRKSKPIRLRRGPESERQNGELRLDSVSEIRPSPENEKLYRPADPADPEIEALAKSIRERGILEPLVITTDGFILSGHRRYAAAKLAGLQSVPCRTVPIRRSDDLDAFVRLLRECNLQRDKTRSEKLREEIISINPNEAHRKLIDFRRVEVTVGFEAMELSGPKRRCKISEAKQSFLNTSRSIITNWRRFWPLSIRRIFYALLNDPPLMHASKQDSRFKNDRRSYNQLDELLTRARLAGLIPMSSIDDETRPIELWNVHPNPRPFIRQELKGMFRGYWRDLMQSQPNHLELLAEKNTVLPIIKPVACDYTIPMTIGRGFSSLPPRAKLAARFKRSGKEKLILLILSDFDPAGEEIAHSFARSMRDDFGIDAIHPIKVALTAQQVAEHRLPPRMVAKESSISPKFIEAHGANVFELEALSPEALQEILRSTIESVIDRSALDEEIEAEKADAAHLEGIRRTVREALADIDLGDDE